jgi:hypothetical protein
MGPIRNTLLPRTICIFCKLNATATLTKNKNTKNNTITNITIETNKTNINKIKTNINKIKTDKTNNKQIRETEETETTLKSKY